MHPTIGASFVFDCVAVICFAIASIPLPAPANDRWRYVLALGLVFLTLGHMG